MLWLNNLQWGMAFKKFHNLSVHANTAWFCLVHYQFLHILDLANHFRYVCRDPFTLKKMTQKVISYLALINHIIINIL